MSNMLQWLYTYVAIVCSKFFTYFRQMLQVFYLHIVICCSGYTHMLQTYVSIVAPGQYVAANATPHALWPAGTHVLHALIQCCLSLSCGPTPIVERARNEQSPKWLSTPWSAGSLYRSPETATWLLSPWKNHRWPLVRWYHESESKVLQSVDSIPESFHISSEYIL
jgi:hypothetical protein